MSLGDLAVLDDQSVTLAAGVAEDGGTVEGQVKGRCQLAVRVGEEADARLASGVKRGTPGAHSRSELEDLFQVTGEVSDYGKGRDMADTAAEVLGSRG